MIASVSGMPRQLDMGMASPSTGVPRSEVALGQTFSETLGSLLVSSMDNLRQGEVAAVAGIQGRLSAQTVVEQVLAAERTLQAGIAIRDKIVGAYLEVSRMQI